MESCQLRATAPTVTRMDHFGKYCNGCNANQVVGHVILIKHNKFIDATTIAQILSKNQEMAMADHPYRTGIDEMKSFGILQMEEKLPDVCRQMILSSRSAWSPIAYISSTQCSNRTAI